MLVAVGGKFQTKRAVSTASFASMQQKARAPGEE